MSTLLSANQLPPNRHDDLENYAVDDDPFATPSPPPSSAKKRKEGASQGLGIDEEVSVAKRARVPNVKLDEDRLLGPSGLPKLRQRARDLRLKGKGHEFTDAARLLSFYQMWLDDLFPKAKFLDALAMVEKTGHKKRVVATRNEYLNEGKPSSAATVEEEEEEEYPNEDGGASGVAAQNNAAGVAMARAETPSRNTDVPDDEDLYGATPRPAPRTTSQSHVPDDEDDLDALIAEAEDQDLVALGQTRSRGLDPHANAGEMDELNALLAEVETLDGDAPSQAFGDDEAAMQELEGL